MSFKKFVACLGVLSILSAPLSVCATEVDADTNTETDVQQDEKEVNVDVVVNNDISVDFDGKVVVENVEELADAYSKKMETVIKTYSKQIVDGIDKSIDDATKEILDALGTTTNITEVYSINNLIGNAYYKPKLEDLDNLEALVLSKGFASAYTGYWDLNYSSVKAPSQVTGRALSILGADFALSSERYSGGQYTAKETSTSSISYTTAIMNTYKALGLEEYVYVVTHEKTSKEYLQQSPAIQNLPGTMQNLDGSRGKTKVFVTRTDPSVYKDKALNELKLSNAYINCSDGITAGDFIVLVHTMMDHYGEPVLSTSEMNAMLQVYGGDIPTYLTDRQREAYMYLKAKGCLNDSSINYTRAITLQQMLDILVCVADEDSRSTYKNIQLTMEVGSDLQSRGYFPKTVQLVPEEDTVEFAESYDYSTAICYDYYIEIDDLSRFVKNGTNTPVSDLFVPSRVGDPSSPALDSSKYLGVVSDTTGKQYYHFQIPILDSGHSYFSSTKGQFGGLYFQINTLAADDLPLYIWVQQGGGIYKVNAGNKAGGLSSTRIAFADGQFEGAASAERCGKDLVSYGLKERIADFAYGLLGVQTVLADEAHANELLKGNGVSVDVAIVHAERFKQESIPTEKDIPGMKIVQTLEADGSITINATVPELFVDYFYARLERNPYVVGDEPVLSLATLYGDVMVRYQDLVDSGYFYADEDGVIDLNSDILVLDSKNGMIRVNQKTNEIVVGQTIYRVASQVTRLWDVVNGELYVDFRVAHGWTDNILDMQITGTGDSYAVKVVPKNLATWNVATAKVKLPREFRNTDDSEYIAVIPAGVAMIGENPTVLMTSQYPLSNWFIYQTSFNGEIFNYLCVFYHKSMFPTGMALPDGMTTLKTQIGYSAGADDWVCRVTRLEKKSNATPGQFTYSEQYGFLYNLPKWEDFTLDAYLSGLFALPLSYDGSYIINANVNLYGNYPFGTRPVDSHYAVNIKGEKFAYEAGSQTEIVLKPAPAGVVNFYGSTQTSGTTLANIGVTMGTAETNATHAKSYFYGTTKCTVSKDKKDNLILSMKVGLDNPWSWQWRLKDNSVFYIINKRVNESMSSVSVREYNYWFASFDTIVVKDYSETVEAFEEEKEEIEIIVDNEQEDKFKDFEQLSLEYLLTKINQFSTWVILFTIYVLPIVGIIGLTLIFGFAYIARNKLFVKIFSKTIDPVKFLTAGQLTIEQINLKKSLIGLIVGYIAFGLLLDGNIIKVVVWLSEAFEGITQLIRQL